MAAKKSKADVPVEEEGTPDPSGAQEGGLSVERYFNEQDQVPGSRRNPLKTAPRRGEGDLISTVEACRLINDRAKYLMFDPAALYRDAGKTAPSAHELSPGDLRFSREECIKYVDEVLARREARQRLKAEEAAAAKEMAEFYGEQNKSPNPGAKVEPGAQSQDFAEG
ncbi:MAG: hypothetical protein NXI30_04465 [bacterium]|nr:hypothetical protein [bacterium]